MKVATLLILLTILISCSKKVITTDLPIPIPDEPVYEVPENNDNPQMDEIIYEESEEKIIYIYFQFNSDKITPFEKTKLNQVDKRATLTGGTCDIGSEEYNYTLGLRRAYSVKKELDMYRIKTVIRSVGEHEPISDEREKNRRCEIRF